MRATCPTKISSIAECEYKTLIAGQNVCWLNCGISLCWSNYSLQHGNHSNPTTPKLQKHRTKNNTTNVVLQQNSRKLLMMDILMSETYWTHKKWNKVASHIKLVFYSSTADQYSVPNAALEPGCTMCVNCCNIKRLQTLTIRHIYVISMINSNDFDKGHQQVFIMEIQCLLCCIERNFHIQFGYILCFKQTLRPWYNYMF